MNSGACFRSRFGVDRSGGLKAAFLAGTLGLLIAGCGQTPLSLRYRAEQALWRARRIERRATLGATVDATALRSAIADYRELLQRYPVQAAGADLAEAGNVAGVRAAAALSLSALLLKQGDVPGAIQALASERGDQRADLDSRLRICSGLIQLLSQSAGTDSLAQVYRDMETGLPPVDATGQPIPLVLDAPNKLAEVLQQAGKNAEAVTALADASDYYSNLSRDHAGTALAVAAQMQLAQVRIRQGRGEDAVAILRQARSLPGEGPFDGSILYSVGMIREERLRDPAGATDDYRDLVRSHPSDALARQAQLRIGIAYSEAGRSDSALAVFTRTEQDFSHDAPMASQARYLGASVLMAQGKGAAAVQQLKSVTTDYPRTEAGLLAPLEVASWYEKNGDSTAESATLRDAATEYERLIRDLSGDAGQTAVVLSALDHLGTVRLQMKDWQEAVHVLLERADLFPQDPRSALAMAQAAEVLETRLSDRPGAARTLELMLQRFPAIPTADRTRQKIAQLKADHS